MSALVVYYSRTGVTRKLVEGLVQALRDMGVAVDAQEVKLRREYGRPLHLNPKLIADTLRGDADVEVAFDPCPYKALILACPVWFNKPAAPIAAFLRRVAGQCRGKPTACITTSIMSANFSIKLATLAEAAGLRVVFQANAPKGLLPVKPVELARALGLL